MHTETVSTGYMNTIKWPDQLTSYLFDGTSLCLRKYTHEQKGRAASGVGGLGTGQSNCFHVNVQTHRFKRKARVEVHHRLIRAHALDLLKRKPTERQKCGIKLQTRFIQMNAKQSVNPKKNQMCTPRLHHASGEKLDDFFFWGGS